MQYNIVYKCSGCSNEIEIPSHPRNNCEYDAGKCHCGGKYYKSGESYDREFIEQEEYERRQDEEYEQRHRYDR